MSETKIARNDHGEQLEVDCTITGPEGQTFEAGGSYVYLHEDGLLRACLYANMDGTMVGTWNSPESGGTRVPMKCGDSYRSNKGDTRVPVWFTWDGVAYAGTYYKSSSDIVRAKQIKSQGKKENQ